MAKIRPTYAYMPASDLEINEKKIVYRPFLTLGCRRFLKTRYRYTYLPVCLFMTSCNRNIAYPVHINKHISCIYIYASQNLPETGLLGKKRKILFTLTTVFFSLESTLHVGIRAEDIQERYACAISHV